MKLFFIDQLSIKSTGRANKPHRVNTLSLTGCREMQLYNHQEVETTNNKIPVAFSLPALCCKPLVPRAEDRRLTIPHESEHRRAKDRDAA